MQIKKQKIEIQQKAKEIYNLCAIRTFEIIKKHSADNQYPEKVRGVLPIYEFILDRLRAVAIMAENNLLWDAEMVVRAISEATVKLLFICLTPESERKKVQTEYWIDLAEINELKQSKQAKLMLEQFKGNSIFETTFKPIVISEERESEILAKKNRKERKSLEQKWSFTELVNSLSKNYKGESIPLILTMAHNYRMSSHLIHADEIGVSIIKERNSRTEEQQDIVNMAHYGRLFSDIVIYSAWSGVGIMNILKEDTKFFFDTMKKFEGMSEVISKYNEKIFGLDDMYEFDVIK